jgi:hypothetical protein
MRIPLCTRLAVLTWCLLGAPAAHAADTQAMEDACRRAATADGVTRTEMDDYMDDCLSEAMQNLDDAADPRSERGDDSRRGDDSDTAPEGDQEPAPVD